MLQDFLFRGIAKGEWQNLLDFLQAKKIRIDNLQEAKMGPGAGEGALDLGEDIDTGAWQPQAADCKHLHFDYDQIRCLQAARLVRGFPEPCM